MVGLIQRHAAKTSLPLGAPEKHDSVNENGMQRLNVLRFTTAHPKVGLVQNRKSDIT